MDKIRKRFEKINYYTLLKYFLSYFFLLSFLLLCFFIAFRKQLRTAYSTARDNSIQEKLVLFQQSFNNDLDHVFNIHYNLCNNTNLKMLRHSFDSSWYSSLGITDMREFASANPLVSDIIYIQKNGGKVLACKNYIYKSNDEYYFSINHKALKIPVGKYGHDNKNTMVYIKNQELSLLLLFPNVASSKYELFYVIDSDEIIARLNNMLSEEISGVYLTDSENNIISASGDYSVPPVYRLTDSYGLQKNDEGDEIIYTVPLHTNLFLTVCFSKDVLLQYASKAFINMYMVFAAIGCTGFLLILFGMRLTYSPLHRLSKKFADRAGDNKGLESQLDFALSSALQEQRKLQEKIEKYHSIMKESVLDTIVNENGEEITAENMDRLFNGEPGSLMFVIKISAPADGEGMAWVTKSFRDFFLGTFPNNDSFCIRLEITPKYCSYLIYYGGQDQDKYNVIKYLLHDFYKEYGCRIALSNGSSSPLDIPNLYANAMQAGNYWDSHPIAFYDEMDIPKDSAYTYPYQELSSFASLLQQLKFEEAKKAIRSFFQTLDQTDFPAFYSRSVLTEVLTTIITNMNQQNIKFSAYNNIYFETLYFIRSFSYEQKSNDIYAHFIMLLSLFEDELSNLTIKSGELQDFINQSYTSKDLTIAMLAEKFHVSIACMSYLFKKYFNEYFSDYLWKLRVAKAKELLRGTSKPMEEICIAVGYENVSSFRRKFKKELGITPSQYRNGTEPVTEKSRGESQ